LVAFGCGLVADQAVTTALINHHAIWHREIPRLRIGIGRGAPERIGRLRIEPFS
jgi:hypothetical protein